MEIIMRFIGNFIVFGLIFYLIYFYQPDFFSFLVGLAERSVLFAKSFFSRVVEGMNEGPVPTAVSSLLSGVF